MTHCLVYILQLTVFEFRNASCIFFFLFVCLVFVWGDSSFIFYCFYLTEKCCIFTVNIRFVLRSYGTLSERKEQWHHPAAEQAQWDTRYKHPCEWTLDQKHSLFFNPFGLLIKRNNKQTQNTVKDACAYDSHSDLSINMTLCKVPGICYFQLLFLFHINGNRNFWSPALLIWQKQRDLTLDVEVITSTSRKQILF